MKGFRCFAIIFSISVIMMIQGCGTGGGNSDTSGGLTLSTPTFTDNLNGTSIGSVTVTYTPSAGKSIQGVVVTISITTNSGTVLVNSTATFNSADTGKVLTFIAPNSTLIHISAAVNGMTAGTTAFVPSGAIPTSSLAVSSATAAFLATDVANTTTPPVNVSGGTLPWSVISTVPLDIGASITQTPILGVITITLKNTATPPGLSNTATVIVTDAVGATKTITVTYFK